MARPIFYLIDGSSVIYRAYHALRPLSTAGGLPTHAVHGFTKIVLKLIEEGAPDYLAVVFDAAAPTFRHATYAGYKADRGPMPDDLAIQIPYIHRMVDALQIQSVAQEGYEADDLIGTLARRGETAGWQVVIVSGDKDFDQLASPHVVLYDPMKGTRRTEADVAAKWGVAPSQVVEVLGLMGDPVDRIPGVRGIGEKTAGRLIAEFGTIENLLAQLESVKPERLREMLRADADSARMSRDLARIDVHCPVAFDMEIFLRKPFDAARVAPLCHELELSNLFKTLFPPSESSPIPAKAMPPLFPDLDTAIAAILQETRVAVVPDMTEEGLWKGVALATLSGVFYLPLSEERLPPALADVMASASIVKYGHDVKPHIRTGRAWGIAVRALWDTMIAAYLLAPGRRDYSLAAVAEVDLGITLSGEASGDACGYRAQIVLQLAEAFAPRLSSDGLVSLFTEIEMPLVPVLVEIEATGIGIDLAWMAEISRDLEGQLAEITKTIYTLAGDEFNLASPKQLAAVLFERLHLPVVRKTKTGPSTDEDVLTQLAPQHPLPAAILERRRLSKLKATYVDVLLRVARGGRVYTRLNQTVAATGRLSSSDPNLQNIPAHGAWGRRIRGAFVAAPGAVLLSADYNQIELRILAHLSDDPLLIEAFRRGDDIHLQTAMRLFGLPKEAITPDMRRTAKTIGFGILYGISPFGLSLELGISQDEARGHIETYFSHYAGVTAFIEQTKAVAAKSGYVTTLFGRRRPIDRPSGGAKLNGAQERIAVNSPVQGSAADIIKRAMINMALWMQQTKVQSRMLLQVHDELLFEVPQEEVELMTEKATTFMAEAASLKVPLVVHIGTGRTWAETH